MAIDISNTNRSNYSQSVSSLPHCSTSCCWRICWHCIGLYMVLFRELLFYAVCTDDHRIADSEIFPHSRLYCHTTTNSFSIWKWICRSKVRVLNLWIIQNRRCLCCFLLDVGESGDLHIPKNRHLRRNRSHKRFSFLYCLFQLFMNKIFCFVYYR